MMNQLPTTLTFYNVVIYFKNRDPWRSRTRFSEPPTFEDFSRVIEEFTKEYDKNLQGTAWTVYRVLKVEVEKTQYVKGETVIVEPQVEAD